MIPVDVQQQIAAASSRDAHSLHNLRRWLELVEADTVEVTELQNSLAARITPWQPRESIEAERARFDIQQDIRLLATGFGQMDGYNDPRLRGRVGQPGLGLLQRWKVKLTNLIVEAEQHLATNAAGSRPYRYTGPAYKHQMGDRFLAVGDVVELTPQQAAAWQDRFEAVAEQAVAEQAVEEQVTS